MLSSPLYTQAKRATYFSFKKIFLIFFFIVAGLNKTKNDKQQQIRI